MRHRKRNAKGRFVKSGGVNPRHKARRRHKRNPSPVYALANRRKTRRRNPIANRRRHRRNPPGQLALLGVSLPSVETIAWTGAGFLAPPFIEGFARRYLPAEFTGNMLGRYALKLGAVFGTGWLAGNFAGTDARNKVMLGGGVYILANLVSDFVPQLMAGTAARTGYYQRTLGRTGAQPMLGRYSPTNGALGSMGSAMTIHAPTRLQPEQRF